MLHISSYHHSESAVEYSHTMGCSVLQCVAMCCSVLQCVAVYCSVLQCAAVYCWVMYTMYHNGTLPSFFGLFLLTYHGVCVHVYVRVNLCIYDYIYTQTHRHKETDIDTDRDSDSDSDTDANTDRHTLIFFACKGSRARGGAHTCFQMCVMTHSHVYRDSFKCVS